MTVMLHKTTDEQDPWLRDLCVRYNDNYGRGWKRKLASELGVHETNIQNWLRSGKVPAAIKTLVARNEEIELLKKELSENKKELSAYKDSVIIIDNNDNTYSVKLFDPDTGLYKPPEQSLRNARKIASALSGKVDKLISDAIYYCGLDDRCDHPDEKIRIENLRNWGEMTSREKLIEKEKNAKEDAEWMQKELMNLQEKEKTND